MKKNQLRWTSAVAGSQVLLNAVIEYDQKFA